MDRIVRDLEKPMLEHLKNQKVLMLFGARRVGKTVLIKQILESFTGSKLLLNGESQDVVRLLEDRSIANYSKLFSKTELLVIDEAQHIPDIGMKLKLMVDELPGLCIIATGSSSFDLKNNAAEPLVGRGTQFLLTSFSQSELSRIENPFQTQSLLDERLVYGTYPELISLSTYAQKEEYMVDLVDSYLLRDILSYDGIKNSNKLHDLLRLIAYQVGSEVSYDNLAKQIGLSRNTVEKYIDLLEKVFVIYKVGAYSKNLRKEINNGVKLYFFDTGVRNAIIRDFRPYVQRSDIDRGGLFENYFISEIKKKNLNQKHNANLYFWRTYDNQEIDLIEEYNGSLVAYEIKSGSKIAKAPKAFSTAYPEASFIAINRDNYLDYICL